jgi:hypothetical protein
MPHSQKERGDFLFPVDATSQIILTHELIESGQSRVGGWSAAQLLLLGIQWPPRQGWKRRLVGTQIKRSDFQKFLALKDAHLDSKDAGQWAFRQFMADEATQKGPRAGNVPVSTATENTSKCD